MSATNSTLGIIAGGGRLPVQLVEACKSSYRNHFVLTFEESPNEDAIRHAPHAVVRLGAVGESLKKLREAGVTEVVLAGRVRRPTLTRLKPDMTATKLLGRLGKAFFGGDDALLRSLVSFLEGEGFTVVSPQQILGNLIAGTGVLGRVQPSDADKADITVGLQAARELGRLDIGQAVIVEDTHVLGLEAEEGTDALIGRCAGLKKKPRGGVLVKAKKPSQEERVDLPAIGIATVERAHEAGLSGIAVEAGSSLILDREQVIARADQLGIFLVGIGDG
jgi:DUF1009 family protein